MRNRQYVLRMRICITQYQAHCVDHEEISKRGQVFICLLQGASNVFHLVMATTSKCKVSFSENVTEEGMADSAQHETSDSDSESDFYEITSSEPESVCSSDEEDAERLEVVLEGAYTCSPTLYRSSNLDPAERSSLLFLDKDIGESGDERK